VTLGKTSPRLPHIPLTDYNYTSRHRVIMKPNLLPVILISLTVVVGINLWAIERDREMLWYFCGEQSPELITPLIAQQQGMYCE